MRVTKFGHSCLLIEDGGHAVLTDPGVFSWTAGIIDVKTWPKIDEIVITHEHADHFHVPFIKAVLAKNPEAMIVTNESVKAKLAEANISRVTTDNTTFVTVAAVPHERVPASLTAGPTPNVRADIFGRLTTPGDSHSFASTKEVLAMPFIAPWGSMTAASDIVEKLRPAYVIPIHDWFWKPEALENFYAALRNHYADEGIQMLIPTDGEAFEI